MINAQEARKLSIEYKKEAEERQIRLMKTIVADKIYGAIYKGEWCVDILHGDRDMPVQVVEWLRSLGYLVEYKDRYGNYVDSTWFHGIIVSWL